MIDKKKLIEELLDCVADATDTETQITSLTMAGMLMNQVLDEALTIPAVSGRSEQLKAFDELFNYAWNLAQYSEEYAKLNEIRDSF